MKGLNLFAIFFICISCRESKENTLDVNLYNVLLDYQKTYPIPDKNPKKLIYIYKAYFWKVNRDTVLEIQRSPAGINKLDKGFGVYIDDILKPTLIYDKDSLGKEFILKKLINESKKQYYWINKGNAPESFPPIYSYLVRDKKMILVKIDTVWKHWD